MRPSPSTWVHVADSKALRGAGSQLSPFDPPAAMLLHEVNIRPARRLPTRPESTAARLALRVDAPRAVRACTAPLLNCLLGQQDGLEGESIHAFAQRGVKILLHDLVWIPRVLLDIFRDCLQFGTRIIAEAFDQHCSGRSKLAVDYATNISPSLPSLT